VIYYEYPLNERLRMLLRLEDLCDRLAWYSTGEHPLQHHGALLTLFEISEITARTDVKTDLMQELERQRQALLALTHRPGVDETRLRAVLADIEQVYQNLYALSGKIAQHIRDSDWLTAVKQRAAIPGGLCEFDVPSYHRWLHQPLAVRKAHLASWEAPLQPIRDGFRIVLRLLRQGADSQRLRAEKGLYQSSLGGGAAGLIRIGLDEHTDYVPEISANKYALNIRFLSSRPEGIAPCREDVSFELTFCNFG
jgi:cell division protein ZapD